MNNERLKHIIRSANNIINRVESPDFKLDKGSMEERMAELKSNTEVPLMTAEQIQMMTGQAPAQPQYHQQQQLQQPNVSHLPVDQQKSALEQEYNRMFNEQYGHMLQNQQTPVIQPNAHLNPNAVNNSKLPNFIKEAMVNQPIQQLNPANYIGGTSFSLEDVADIVNENNTTQQYQQPQQSVQSIGNVTEQTIRTIVREEVMEMMGRYFGNNINEDLEKKLIQKLIKEGKIKTVSKKK